MQNKYFPTFPYLTSERSKKFFGIILTFCALSFFGFFAIKPTVSTILKLQKELSDTENKIQAARRFYNTNVRDLNIKVESFPNNLVAGAFRFSKMEFFQLEESAAKSPVEVKF